MSKASEELSQKLRGEMKVLPVTTLDLDPENPRLPEYLIGSQQDDLIAYLFDNGVLEELAQSFADNGFFIHEPLIVTPSSTEGRFIVLEGNRRLAALKIVLGHTSSDEFNLGVDVHPERLAELAEIPCYVVATRSEVFRFLGFRHIGGIKTWGAEAKARYIVAEVDRAAMAGASDPFRDVGKRVGSNALGVRNSYVALKILSYAQEVVGLNVRELRNKRFGVWSRALNSKDVRAFIGLKSIVTYADVAPALAELNSENLNRVLIDLTPPADGKPLIRDSRDVDAYGRILQTPVASEMLVRYRDFEAAKRIVEDLDLPSRIRKVKTDCEILLTQIQTATPSQELANVTADLLSVVRSINATAKAALEELSE